MEWSTYTKRALKEEIKKYEDHHVKQTSEQGRDCLYHSIMGHVLCWVQEYGNK